MQNPRSKENIVEQRGVRGSFEIGAVSVER